MGDTNGLIILDRATQMLAEVRSVDDARDLIDLAEAARVYARQVNLGLEAQNHATEIKLRAQRRAGEILQSMEKAKGVQLNGTDSLGGYRLQPPSETPTYSDLGIDKRDAHIWQTLATMPGDEFEDKIVEIKQEGKELSTAALYREAKRAAASNKPESPNPPTGKYRVIYADPPWKYNDRLTDGYGPAEFHYPTMTIEELCALPVREMAEDNAVLFLWVTSPFLEDSFKIIRAWGFEYKASFVWDKVGHNYGHYNSVRHEFLLVCTRGSCTPDESTLFDSVQSIPKTDKHSQKPEEFRRIIETLYTEGEKLELFARGDFDGWDCWGNETGG